jgi:hypothetical protein
MGGRKRLVAGLTAVVALAAAASAAADRQRVKLTAEGQSVAKLAILERADFGRAPGWSGGPVRPDLTSTSPCADFNPRQSDLLVIGAAESRFDHVTGLRFDTEAEVLQTPHMVDLDWQRTIADPRAIACYRKAAFKQSTPREKVLSFRRVAVPRLARYSARFRVVIQATSAASTFRVTQDVILLGKGRTELTIEFVSPISDPSVIEKAELAVAKQLAARAKP